MEIAILVFFIAIGGGVLFLLGLLWFIFRRIRKSRPGRRNFAGGSTNHGGEYHQPQENLTDFDDDSGAIYVGGALSENQESENLSVSETAQDSPQQSGGAERHANRGEFGAPAETSYSESSYSSSDSGSSYDSGSGSDSGSSASDSGSSSSD